MLEHLAFSLLRGQDRVMRISTPANQIILMANIRDLHYHYDLVDGKGKAQFRKLRVWSFSTQQEADLYTVFSVEIYDDDMTYSLNDYSAFQKC